MYRSIREWCHPLAGQQGRKQLCLLLNPGCLALPLNPGCLSLLLNPGCLGLPLNPGCLALLLNPGCLALLNPGCLPLLLRPDGLPLAAGLLLKPDFLALLLTLESLLQYLLHYSWQLHSLHSPQACHLLGSLHRGLLHRAGGGCAGGDALLPSLLCCLTRPLLGPRLLQLLL
jgi:hypothetical protein